MVNGDGEVTIVDEVRWSVNVCSKCGRDRLIYAVTDGIDPHAEWT